MNTLNKSLKLHCSWSTNRRRRKTVPIRNSFEEEKTIFSGHPYLQGTFNIVTHKSEMTSFSQTRCMGKIFLLINIHCTGVYLIKKNQEGLLQTGLQGWPVQFTEHIAHATCVSPSPAVYLTAVLCIFSICSSEF